MTYNQLTTEQFVERARNIHGNKYDYSETVYISTNKEVAIRCKRHGIFIQHAGNHIISRLKSADNFGR